ncbi:MAG: phosphatase PAP2 family protein [Actinomycetota bacterium]|jgi:membrane-associated phospholipid phosphatase|tara:strand:- start:5530 stop:6201 length:672 start_codon:yes stop_codon:yes gene_type:complete
MTTEQLARRRQEMFHALRVSGLLFLGFAFITQQVLTRGWLYELDHYILNLKNPQFEGFAGHILIALDDLGLRWLTATILLISSAIIGWRFKSFRPFNLSLLAVLSLNLVVGATKLIIGRTKPRLYIDVLQAGGMSYPSGHASNALLSWGLLAYLIYRYTNRAPFQGLKLYPIVGLITATVVVVSLIRNTHWFSDLLGGVFIGGALLVAIIAADRFVPSEKQPS